MIKNFVFSIIAIFSILILFFSSLNFFLSGVPLFSIFKINISDAVYVLKDEKLKKDLSKYQINLLLVCFQDITKLKIMFICFKH